MSIYKLSQVEEVPVSTMLVIPTCRPESLGAFFKAWEGKGGWDEVCVVEDAPTRSESVTKVLPPGARHVSHTEMAATLGEDQWIISRRDSAIRCFGFLVAYHLGMDVLTLDDDCWPLPTENYNQWTLVERHQNALVHCRWVESVPGMRTRGLPYWNKGRLVSKVNVGLWTGVPDLDGPQGLLAPIDDFVPPDGNRLIPNGQYVPVCGMNLHIRHEALPLMYFPLMGEGQPYKRFDDIWAGIIAKKALDTLGWNLSVGEPFVRHLRASNPFANLVKESPGIVANETFWEMIDAVPLTYPAPIEVMGEMGKHLETAKTSDPYMIQLGKAINVWVRRLTEPFPLTALVENKR